MEPQSLKYSMFRLCFYFFVGKKYRYKSQFSFLPSCSAAIFEVNEFRSFTWIWSTSRSTGLKTPFSSYFEILINILYSLVALLKFKFASNKFWWWIGTFSKNKCINEAKLICLKNCCRLEKQKYVCRCCNDKIFKRNPFLTHKSTWF